MLQVGNKCLKIKMEICTESVMIYILIIAYSSIEWYELGVYKNIGNYSFESMR